MMKLKPGDQVRFLNEVGGGVVTQILSQKLVKVRNSDGFEVPTLIKELVKIDNTGVANNIFTETSVEETTPPEPIIIKQEEENQRFSEITKNRQKESLANGVYLAWIPQNPNLPLVGDLDFYLINDTLYSVPYSLMMKEEDGTFSGTDFDIIPPNSQLLIEVIEREDLNRWNAGVVQLLFHEETNSNVKRPISCAFEIKAARFFKEDNFREYISTPRRAFVYEICTTTLIQPLHHHNRASKDKSDSIEGTIGSTVKPKMFIDKHCINRQEAEVDLHIEKLREKYYAMTSHEMLQFQKRYFVKALESAINKKLKTVTFIHGVGKGKLKEHIIDILEDYKSVKYHDASLRKYGSGAITVSLFSN